MKNSPKKFFIIVPFINIIATQLNLVVNLKYNIRNITKIGHKYLMLEHFYICEILMPPIALECIK